MTRKQEVSTGQAENAQSLQEAGDQEANPLPVGITQGDTEQLGTAAGGILNDLNARLDRAIDTWRLGASRGKADAGSNAPPHSIGTWSQLTAIERNGDGQLPGPQIPGPITPPHSPQAQPKTMASLKSSQSTQDCQKWWGYWGEERTIHDLSGFDLARPMRWWMQEQDHYGLCQLREQGQLESAARASRFIRASAPPRIHQHEKNNAS